MLDLTRVVHLFERFVAVWESRLAVPRLEHRPESNPSLPRHRAGRQ